MIYLKVNIDYLKSEIERELPEIKVVTTEGTYLLWLDFNALNLSQSELDRIIQDEAKLWLNTGTSFGFGGEGFQRVNMATHREVIEKAVKQLIEAFKKQ